MNLLNIYSEYKYDLFFMLSALIASFRPVFFRTYKFDFIFTIFLSLVTMYSGYLIMLYFKNPHMTFSEFKEDVMKVYTKENALMSILSEIRFITKQYSFVLLPISLALPISLLYIPATFILNSYMGGSALTIEKLVISLLIVFGVLLSKEKGILHEIKKISKYISKLGSGMGGMSGMGGLDIFKNNTFLGVMMGLISVIVGSYVYIKLAQLDKSTKDPLYVMGVESGFSLIIFSLILFGGVMLGKIKLPPMATVIKMFVALLFLFNIDIILKFIGLEKISITQSVYISQIYILSSFLIGFLYYKEKISIRKIIGILIVVASSIYGSFISSK
jgi:hypothetical protein